MNEITCPYCGNITIYDDTDIHIGGDWFNHINEYYVPCYFCNFPITIGVTY